MKIKAITLIILSAIIMAACGTSKKTVATATPPKTTTYDSPGNISFLAKEDGIHAPGNEELTAIQIKYKDVTLPKLKQGHALYTQGACVNCHAANNIYERSEAEWKDIIDDMARKADITDDEKDAVYKYVLSIKGTQPK